MYQTRCLRAGPRGALELLRRKVCVSNMVVRERSEREVEYVVTVVAAFLLFFNHALAITIISITLLLFLLRMFLFASVIITCSCILVMIVL